MKSSILNLGSIKTDVCYSIFGSELPVENVVRDLGIQVDSALKFSYHTSLITNAAFRRLGVLLKSFTCRDLSFMRLAFCDLHPADARILHPGLVSVPAN